MAALRVILSGGGTGGHIYPAVAVAEALRRKLDGDVEILFVGAEGKMEMEKVPALGYRIEGLPVAGLQRKFDMRNFALPFKVLKSLRSSRKVLKDFKADIVVGFGGYASAPVLWSAQRMGLLTIIQEQNSFAGVTNKMLGKKARQIYVAYDRMDRFFPADRIILSGNPLRGSFSELGTLKAEALAYFGLDPARPTLLVVGGSLGTRTLNNMMKRWADTIIAENRINVIWQTGKYYSEEMTAFMKEHPAANIWYGPFIERMDYAYAASGLIISRSGASSVSELCLVAKPVIFVPSPNVAEDHQTKNAMALVEKGAAVMIPDSEAVEMVIPAAMELLDDNVACEGLCANIKLLARPDAADVIADRIIEISKERK